MEGIGGGFGAVGAAGFGRNFMDMARHHADADIERQGGIRMASPDFGALDAAGQANKIRYRNN